MKSLVRFTSHNQSTIEALKALVENAKAASYPKKVERGATHMVAQESGPLEVCTQVQFDWSRTRVETAAFKTFSGGLFLGFFFD